MKNLSLKKIGIGTALVSTTAGLSYAVPLLAELFAGNVYVAIAVSAVPTLIAYLTNSKTKLENE